MRDIKFRGKRIDNGEWVYGNLVQTINEGVYILKMPSFIPAKTFPAEMFFEVYPESVGQYTGLKDKEGKEIYEGDIVRKPNDLWIGNESVGKDKGTFINCCFIEFVEGSFRINKIGNESKNFYGVINFSRNTKSEKLEVIGNIHDNLKLFRTMTQEEINELLVEYEEIKPKI